MSRNSKFCYKQKRNLLGMRAPIFRGLPLLLVPAGNDDTDKITQMCVEINWM